MRRLCQPTPATISRTPTRAPTWPPADTAAHDWATRSCSALARARSAPQIRSPPAPTATPLATECATVRFRFRLALEIFYDLKLINVDWLLVYYIRINGRQRYYINKIIFGNFKSRAFIEFINKLRFIIYIYIYICIYIYIYVISWCYWQRRPHWF